jgi:hypothetical protein
MDSEKQSPSEEIKDRDGIQKDKGSQCDMEQDDCNFETLIEQFK